ncbi:MAG: ABC transporter permease [Deltaproteobacteria bacterium]|jgi:NitT/TauT family transport system permease protein|nr:ABC transporter permease [Deltaproteobacteria bacterium]
MKFLNKYGSIFLFFLLWEVLSRSGFINPLFWPPFSEVLAAIVRLTRLGILAPQVEASLARAIPGFILAVIVGVPLGLYLGTLNRFWNDFLELPLEVLSQLNPFLLFHLIILFMGIGEAPKVTIVAWTCLWPVLFSSLNGALGVSQDLMKSGRAFGLHRIGLIRKIIWPAACPSVLTGVRLSLGYSLFMLIAAEMMGASSGLGFMVLRSQEAFQLDRMMAFVVVIAFLGLFLDGLFRLLSNKLRPPLDPSYLNTPGD